VRRDGDEGGSSMTPALFDTHCHLDFEAFAADRVACLQAAYEVGVTRLLIPGVSLTDQARPFQMIEAVSRHLSGQSGPLMHAGVGVHPWWIESSVNRAMDDCQTEGVQWGEADWLAHLPSASALAEVAQVTEAVAIGECGLDGAIAVPMSIQEALLRRHLEVAEALQLPVILHVRRARNELLALLKSFSLPAGGVLHAFSGSEALGLQFIKQGLYLGIGSVITYPRATKTVKAVSQLPLNRLLLETDAPSMPIYQLSASVAADRGEGEAVGQQRLSATSAQRVLAEGLSTEGRHLPAHLVLIAERLAQLKGISLAEVAMATTESGCRLFPQFAKG